MNIFRPTSISATMLAMSLISTQGFAAESALPKNPEAQPQSSQSVQPKVDKKTADAAAEKRKYLISDAQAAITETRKALQALDEKKDTQVACRKPAQGGAKSGGEERPQ